MLANIKEIIWEVEITRHWNRTKPVMLGDVLDWIYENDIDQVELHKIIERKWKDTHFTYTPASVMVISLRKEKRKPIDNQSDEIIKFVFDLLPKE